ncbi:hypothetical protein KSP39_PZI003249 [Platanthera zijinensis]|uniref:COP1-interacting protein 7 n=1 Tax=Platanthera zijinensis TaxID=2320716 RepID=A0AAP0GDE0_9ASPA
MNSNVPLDNAFFQLSPRRSRCELFVCADGKTEKLASGFLKPFVTHLKVAEEQSSHPVRVINLEVGRRKNPASWFNKGTIERFVRFVSTPEVLELLNTLDVELSQLEGARKIYSQGAGHQFSGEQETKSDAATDSTKKELVRAIDVRLSAVKQDLATACARASVAGFNLESMPDLVFFADHFGAFRLSEACKNFLSLSQRRPELISHEHSMPSPDIHPQWKNFKDSNISSSSGSDMSIDEPLVEPTGTARLPTTYCGDAQLHRFSNHKQERQVDGEPATPSIEQLVPDSQHFVNKVVESVENLAPSVVSSTKPDVQAGGVSRRLSVQDRINLFESKQKEHSGSPSVAGGNIVGSIVSRLAGGRGEHHRNPSDISVEKLVLRRWSGASDMSIDPNSNSSGSIDQKESGSTAGTPTSSVISQLQISSKISKNEGSALLEASNYPGPSSQNSSVSNSSTSSSAHGHGRSFPQGKLQAMDEIHKEGISSTFKVSPGSTKEHVQANTWMHMSGIFLNSRRSGISKEPGDFQTNSRSASEDSEIGQMVSQIHSTEPLPLEVPTVQNDQASPLAQIGAITSKLEDAGAKSECASDSQIHVKTYIGKMEDISANDDSVHPEAIGCDFYEQLEAAEQTNLAVPQLRSNSFSVNAQQVSTSEGLRFLGKTSEADYIKKLEGKRDDIIPIEGSNAPPFQIRKANDDMEIPFDKESQTSRPNTDNELNDVLHLKAEELEKLFAEHKLKIRVDQITSAQRRRNLKDHANNVEKRPAQSHPQQQPEDILLQQCSSNGVEVDFNLSGIVESVDLSDSKSAQSDIPRGKLYEKYMRKRDAKLSQECGSKKAQKEAKMKEMHDRLELSQAEMNARLIGFWDGQRMVDARLRAEKLRSFNLHSALIVKEQTSKSLTGDEDEVDQTLCEPSTGNQSKKISSYEFLPTTSITSLSLKHSVKSANSGSVKHKAQTENPVSQLVPAFSNLKNENIKPSVIVTKATIRGQPRNFTRSKSSIEDAEILKEDRSRWSSSMRKSLATPAELKDLSPLNSEKTLRRIQVGVESKQYLKRGNGVNHGSVNVSGKSRILVPPEELNNNEKSEEIVSQKENSPEFVGDENIGRTFIDADNQVMDLHIDSDGEKSRHSQESCESESEIGDLMRPLSQRDDPTTIFSAFNSSRSADDSLEESSGSLNSHVYHSHAYTREASDIYSVDSPTDSPSWNSHSLSQIMDSEAARMRKKWGSAQVPVITAGASQQSRRDVTKGFKRLLKFGRKSRGADYLVNDWVSASTASEGDDDPEDGRDLGHRPSDDYRKSRMGYNITSYDGFNDIGIFQEQAQSLGNSIPNAQSDFRLRDDHLSGSSLKAHRSFFSLSSFRSKAGDSKPR